jgi:hypothetical protein
LVAGFGTFLVVERAEWVVCFLDLDFDLALARAFALAVGVVADGDSTPEETREECLVR